MDFDRTRSIEQLEGTTWGAPEYDSHLVLRCHALRKKELNEFDVEDLRMMVGQDIGLDYLVPLGLEALESNIFAEGDFYEGDLLKSMLTIGSAFWISNPKLRARLCELFEANERSLAEFDTTDKIREGWFQSYRNLKKAIA